MEAKLYDLNKQLVTQLPAMSDDDLNMAKRTIADFYEETSNKYYMLLCRERGYYTVFDKEVNTEICPSFPEIVMEVLTNDLGELVSVDRTDGGLEIWIKNFDESSVYYLFPYDLGVIKYQ